MKGFLALCLLYCGFLGIACIIKRVQDGGGDRLPPKIDLSKACVSDNDDDSDDDDAERRGWNIFGHQAKCKQKQNSRTSDFLWSTWDEWSACSVTCGSGVRVRSRHCLLASPNVTEAARQQCQQMKPQTQEEMCRHQRKCPNDKAEKPKIHKTDAEDVHEDAENADDGMNDIKENAEAKIQPEDAGADANRQTVDDANEHNAGQNNQGRKFEKRDHQNDNSEQNKDKQNDNNEGQTNNGRNNDNNQGNNDQSKGQDEGKHEGQQTGGNNNNPDDAQEDANDFGEDDGDAFEDKDEGAGNSGNEDRGGQRGERQRAQSAGTPEQERMSFGEDDDGGNDGDDDGGDDHAHEDADDGVDEGQGGDQGERADADGDGEDDAGNDHDDDDHQDNDDDAEDENNDGKSSKSKRRLPEEEEDAEEEDKDEDEEGAKKKQKKRKRRKKKIKVKDGQEKSSSSSELEESDTSSSECADSTDFNLMQYSGAPINEVALSGRFRVHVEQCDIGVQELLNVLDTDCCSSSIGGISDSDMLTLSTSSLFNGNSAYPSTSISSELLSFNGSHHASSLECSPMNEFPDDSVFLPSNGFFVVKQKTTKYEEMHSDCTLTDDGPRSRPRSEDESRTITRSEDELKLVSENSSRQGSVKGLMTRSLDDSRTRSKDHGSTSKSNNGARPRLEDESKASANDRRPRALNLSKPSSEDDGSPRMEDIAKTRLANESSKETENISSSKPNSQDALSGNEHSKSYQTEIYYDLINQFMHGKTKATESRDAISSGASVSTKENVEESHLESNIEQLVEPDGLYNQTSSFVAGSCNSPHMETLTLHKDRNIKQSAAQSTNRDCDRNDVSNTQLDDT